MPLLMLCDLNSLLCGGAIDLVLPNIEMIIAYLHRVTGAYPSTLTAERVAIYVTLCVMRESFSGKIQLPRFLKWAAVSIDVRSSLVLAPWDVSTLEARSETKNETQKNAHDPARFRTVRFLVPFLPFLPLPSFDASRMFLLPLSS